MNPALCGYVVNEGYIQKKQNNEEIADSTQTRHSLSPEKITDVHNCDDTFWLRSSDGRETIPSWGIRLANGRAALPNPSLISSAPGKCDNWTSNNSGET